MSDVSRFITHNSIFSSPTNHMSDVSLHIISFFLLLNPTNHMSDVSLDTLVTKDIIKHSLRTINPNHPNNLK